MFRVDALMGGNVGPLVEAVSGWCGDALGVANRVVKDDGWLVEWG